MRIDGSSAASSSAASGRHGVQRCCCCCCELTRNTRRRCRQKTLEDTVTCTNPGCGNGRRMPLSFWCARAASSRADAHAPPACAPPAPVRRRAPLLARKRCPLLRPCCSAKCLKNRHGEDFEAADASGQWWCPTCRGSCGAGCVICCNCGPCRKKVWRHPGSRHRQSQAWQHWRQPLTSGRCRRRRVCLQAGLEPTHQVVKLARDAGFGNVHDYLVHLVTGERGAERRSSCVSRALSCGGCGRACAAALPAARTRERLVACVPPCRPGRR